MKNFISSALRDAQNALESFHQDQGNLIQMEKAISMMVTSIQNQGRILSCGNGGSMCDSMHFAEELTGRYRKNRPPISAMSMGDPGHMTCVGNDYGFEFIFSRLVEAWGRKGDTLLAISTSGNSPNCIEAVKVARAKGMTIIGLLGKDGGELKKLVDVSLIVSHSVTDRIQEIHIKIIHIMIEGIERQLFPDLYTSS